MRAPSLYSYFASKEAIYDAMFAQGQRELVEALAAVPEAELDRRRLPSGARAFFDFCTADPARYQLLFQRVVPGFEPVGGVLRAGGRAARPARPTAPGGRASTTPGCATSGPPCITGLTDQQISNDPGGDRWSRLLDEAGRPLLRPRRHPDRPDSTDRGRETMTSTSTHESTPHPPPTDDRRQALALAEAAYDRFAGVVESRPGPDDWARPTDCDGWTVRDLVGHMVGAMRSAASVRELPSQQREISSASAAEGGNETDVMTQVQIDRTAEPRPSRRSPAECRALVGRATAGRRRTPPRCAGCVRFPVTMADGTETWTLGYLVDVILTRDAWMHRIDLCRAIDRDAGADADHDGRIVADVVAEWGRRHGAPYRLSLTGPRAAHSPPARPTTSSRWTRVEFCRVVSGRESGSGLLAVQVPF